VLEQPAEAFGAADLAWRSLDESSMSRFVARCVNQIAVISHRTTI
jgi:hypothetical protein